MRRGKLNKTAYALIIISAIFTVISYISDQLVIRYENNLRLNKFDFQKLNTKIQSQEMLYNGLINLNVESSVLVGNELKKKNFFIKHLILFESDKQKFKDHRKNLNIFIDDDFPIYNIKFRAKTSTRTLVDTFIETKNSYINIFNDEIFDNLDFYSKDEFIETFTGNNWFKDNQEKFFKIKDWDTLSKILNETEIENLTLKHWYDLRNFRLLMSEKIFIETNKVSPVIDHIEILIDDNYKDLNLLFSQTKKINAYKNYFILIGIISQILTLFFLLILFRYLIKQKVF